jgi:hypothetical protein
VRDIADMNHHEEETLEQIVDEAPQNQTTIGKRRNLKRKRKRRANVAVAAAQTTREIVAIKSQGDKFTLFIKLNLKSFYVYCILKL